jgi:hypothetical protein
VGLAWTDGEASLDGEWQFFPGDHALADLDSLTAEPITVPGLWEAQGHLALDGVAWYSRSFELADVDGFWTLRFGAVMDIADVYLNDRHLGRHELAFTPFEFDVGDCLRDGKNTLAVRVVDPALDDPEHRRLPHGKQGWAHEAFPSPPSLYLTYGGIWQSVGLHRHGPVVIGEVFVNSDPDSLEIEVELENRAAAAVRARLSLHTLDLSRECDVELGAGAQQTLTFDLGATTAEHWSPESPALNELSCEVTVDGRLSHARSLRYGLRRIALDREQLLIDQTPYRMKSALVQGFWSRELYGAATRDAIVAEVESAKALGFNTLRLHIKAFEPTYLDVCDELGMFLHCDIPIAEPIAHGELGTETELANRAFAAARAQVRRDRNHPSVILWSATNELGIEKPEARDSKAYEEFMRALVALIGANDPTRPIIENDWIEPDPEHVFAAAVLTAHWYGRLDQRYLAKLDAQAARAHDLGRPLFVTELGDWGLPATDVYCPELRAGGLVEPPLAAELAATPWPEDYARFAEGTQRYQGLSDRLQIEILRRHDHVGGYGLTELTDVPYELNGVLDLERREKPAACAEIKRVNQTVLPMLGLASFAFGTGQRIQVPLHVSNDGPQLLNVEIDVRLGDFATTVRFDALPAHRAGSCGAIDMVIPDTPGAHLCLLQLHADGRLVAENQYPIHVVAAARAPFSVRLLGAGACEAALIQLGADIGAHGPTVVAESALDAVAGAAIGTLLGLGETILLLAQEPGSTRHLPFAATLSWLGTGWEDSDDAGWGSSAYYFTTLAPWLRALPAATVLTTEAAALPPRCAFTTIRGLPWPDSTAVGVYKPMPNPLQGALIGEVALGSGRLLFCQLPLAAATVAGDAFAAALLGDLLLSVCKERSPGTSYLSTGDEGDTGLDQQRTTG